MPKMDFRKFDGSDALVWLDSSYFALHHIPDNFCVASASIHLEGRATHWFQSYKFTPVFYD